MMDGLSYFPVDPSPFSLKLHWAREDQEGLCLGVWVQLGMYDQGVIFKMCWHLFKGKSYRGKQGERESSV